MTREHTPGPWRVKDCAVLCDNEHDPLIVCYTDHPSDVLHIGNGPNGGEVEQCYANARLIAAAPDMLAALRRMMMFAPFLDSLASGRAEGAKEVLAEARAAIARATGREG